MVWLIQTSA